MLKSIIAGATALSLTLASTTPLQANGLDREDVGKALLGIAAIAIIGNAIENNRSSATVTRTQRAPVRRSPEPVRRTAALPSECLTQVQTRAGNYRIYGARCLQRNYARADHLPQRCAVQLYTNNGPRRGFDPLCLREAGFNTGRRR